ncbi:rhomboid-like protein [Kitasatospora sp. NPDC049258]|uniref:rhomboid-like protein n=1 Tax=Kitasatospora sp. NPDC049258 TaxID=3155394 RepID=UPI003430BCD0
MTDLSVTEPAVSDGAVRGAAVSAPAGPAATGRAGLLPAVGRLLPTPRRNPFALGYLALLLGTTLFARFGDPGLVQRLQDASSSDAHNLLVRPVSALLFSGLWVAGPVWMPYFWAFLATVAPLERRIGGRRAAGVFAAGHITATLVSQLVVVAAVAGGAVGSGVLDERDIGVSYGVLTTLGALAGLLRPPGRVVALGAAAALIGHQLLTDSDLVTGVGHPVALLVGIALWGRVRRGPGRPLRPLRLRGWSLRRTAPVRSEV